MEILDKKREDTPDAEPLLHILNDISEHGISYCVYNQVLSARIPKFLYFDEYYQIRGYENLQCLKARHESNSLEPSDYPLLGLIELGSLNLNLLNQPQQTEVLLSELGAA